MRQSVSRDQVRSSNGKMISPEPERKAMTAGDGWHWSGRSRARCRLTHPAALAKIARLAMIRHDYSPLPPHHGVPTRCPAATSSVTPTGEANRESTGDHIAVAALACRIDCSPLLVPVEHCRDTARFRF